MADKTVLVMRATGVQGKGAIAHLVNAGWNIRALVADPSSDRAIALKSFGPQISLVHGTWKDPSSIEAALQDCHALLFVQMPSFTDDAELQEARIVLKLAKIAGVRHVVYSSSLVLNNLNVKKDIGHLSAAPAILNKGAVEDLVSASGMNWTLLRPGYFMTNVLPPIVQWMYPDMNEGRMVNSYGPDCVMTLIDPDDIGAFVAAAFNEPEKFSGQTITVVGENVRFDEMMRQFSKTCGHQFELVYRTEDETKKELASPFVSGQVLCIGLERLVDMEEVKKWGVPLTTFKQFLGKHKSELSRWIASKGESTAVPFADSEMPGTK